MNRRLCRSNAGAAKVNADDLAWHGLSWSGATRHRTRGARHKESNTVTPPLPVLDPRINPTLSIRDTGRWLGKGRAAAYEAARAGLLPGLLDVGAGRKKRCSTCAVRVALGLPAWPSEAAPESAA
jgi:hypothetical protein